MCQGPNRERERERERGESEGERDRRIRRFSQRRRSGPEVKREVEAQKAVERRRRWLRSGARNSSEYYKGIVAIGRIGQLINFKVSWTFTIHRVLGIS